MLRIEIKVDGRLARFLEVTKKTVLNRRVVSGFAAAAVVLPVVALAAPISIPHTFQAGDVISSAEVNANFAAVIAGVNDLDTRLTAVEGETGSLSSCTWITNTGSSSTWSLATCPAGSYAISGGCREQSANTTLEMSKPHAPEPTNNAPAATSTGWYCQYAASGAHVAMALCCEL